MNSEKYNKNNNTLQNRTKTLVYIAMFTSLICACSWITIPGAVPFTLQTFAIFTTLLVLGGKYGTVSILCYILLGSFGLPVFSGFKGGVMALVGPTGGYIVGFLVSALLYWAITTIFKNRTFSKMLGLVSSLIAVYTFGTIWFMYITGQFSVQNLTYCLSLCVLPFIPFDILKMILSVVASKALERATRYKKVEAHN